MPCAVNVLILWNEHAEDENPDTMNGDYFFGNVDSHVKDEDQDVRDGDKGVRGGGSRHDGDDQ